MSSTDYDGDASYSQYGSNQRLRASKPGYGWNRGRDGSVQCKYYFPL